MKFAKVDIEGAELMMLNGAKSLFSQPSPPIFEIEMALNTSKGFGYLPNDILEFINSQRDYEYFAIDEVSGSLNKLTSFDPEEIGANVLCFPVGFYRSIRKDLEIKVKD